MIINTILNFLTEQADNENFMFWFMVILWIAVFLITLFIELQTADITIIWFCLASLVSFVLALFKVHFVIQITVFAILSFALLLLTRPLTKKITDKTLIRTNADRIITKIAVVTKEISFNSIGEIKIDNDTWRAITLDDEDIEVGENVSIISFSGNKVVVKKIKKENNINII